MSGIKGLVLLTRLDYLENMTGRQELKSFVDKFDSKGILHQPVALSKEYSEELLNLLDEAILKEYFNGDVVKFREMGIWNAYRIVVRYFQVYVDEKNPAGFLKQFAAMRDFLVGLGDMKIVDLAENSYMFRINYGQTYLESVKQSELGFIEGGLQKCGAKDITFTEDEMTDISIEYRVDWKL